jgi:hypothetical protein
VTSHERKTDVLIGSLKERVSLEDPDINRSVIILKFILKKQEGRTLNGLIWLRIKTSKCCCARGNKISGSKKGGNFTVYLRNDYLLQKGASPLSWLRAIFYPEDGGSMFFYTVASHVLKYTRSVPEYRHI